MAPYLLRRERSVIDRRCACVYFSIKKECIVKYHAKTEVRQGPIHFHTIYDIRPPLFICPQCKNGDGHQEVLKAANPKLHEQLGAVATLADQELVFMFRFRLRSRMN